MITNMRKSIEALDQGFEQIDGSYIYKFGDGYELWFEKLLFDGQYYVALYKDQELLVPKVVIKFGK